MGLGHWHCVGHLSDTPPLYVECGYECALQTALHFVRLRGMPLYKFGFLLVIQVNITSNMTIIGMLLDHRIISVMSHTETCMHDVQEVC